MTKEGKIATLKARQRRIEARGKYAKAPGVLKKVTRQIKNLEETK